MNRYLNVGRSVEKVDSLSLAVGAERFAMDYPLDRPLHLAILYSPHAHAEIASIDDSRARAVPGVVDVYHHGNTPRVLHTTAGQGYPEPSPYDSALFERRMRFAGDRAAMVAAETLDAALEGVEAMRVVYEVLPPVFDPEEAEKGARIAADDAYAPLPVVYKPEMNLAAQAEIRFGDLEKGFAEADFVEENVYWTQYASHCAIEPHAVAAWYDERGRLVIVTATQVPFHVRRIVSRVLGIPVGRIRVIKPRIGGGFGGKQEVFLEQLAAYAALKTRRAVRLCLSRREVFVSSRTRHPMRVRMKTGVRLDGSVTAFEMDALMNSGAYGSHALTVLSNAGSKVLPLFNKVPNVRFFGRTAYTNLPVGGAYRGYGATQGYFAHCQEVDAIARKLGVDVLDFYKRWHIREGETSEVFRALGEGKEGVDQVIRSCRLDECIDRGAEAIGWKGRRGRKADAGGGRVKGLGAAVCMQGSGIPRVDMAAASMKMNEDGSFNLFMGATDLGTGSDTVLSQIAAEVLQIPVDKIIPLSSDTDLTPFDVGAYASSTTYVSGGAVKLCAERVREQVLRAAGVMLESSPEKLNLCSEGIIDPESGKSVTLEDVAYFTLYRHDQFQVQASASFYGTESPPPFLAQFAEVDVDVRTGRIHLVKFVSAIDCGQPINPQLVEGQVEGAALNGISYALWEEYLFDDLGRMRNPSFWDYKIPTTMDLPEMVTILVDSHEETGPFGAKSAGEIAINGPLPAIANAVYDAVGVRLRRAPFTPESVWKLIREKGA